MKKKKQVHHPLRGYPVEAKPSDPVQRNVETVARLEQAAQAQGSRLDRVSDVITQFIGSLPFLALHPGALWAHGSRSGSAGTSCRPRRRATSIRSRSTCWGWW